MNFLRRWMDTWISATVALSLLGIAIWYVAASTRAASRQISRTHLVANSLSRTAEGAVRIVNNRGQIERLETRRDELQQLMADSHKQGLVAPQLSEAARNLNLSVIEIVPVMQQGAAIAADLPRYRVMLQGDYRSIAAYMHGCTRQRIPTRVVSFEIRPDAVGGNTLDASGRLRATITIEAFLDIGKAIPQEGDSA